MFGHRHIGLGALVNSTNSSHKGSLARFLEGFIGFNLGALNNQSRCFRERVGVYDRGFGV